MREPREAHTDRAGHRVPGRRDLRLRPGSPQRRPLGTDAPRHGLRGRPRSNFGVLVYGTYSGQPVVGIISAAIFATFAVIAIIVWG